MTRTEYGAQLMSGLVYDAGTLVHMDCDGSAKPERKAEICTTCWLTKPCDCEPTP